ncbi:LysE family translocator [Pseudonocardia acaciae]|uniref:LysE family translocator n=1 Tax=Pseudonocardia acaciae TaxID=551276 RepID=UPI00048C6C9E|nr:LysE family translocator [Pseudonocardia acaciae]
MTWLGLGAFVLTVLVGAMVPGVTTALVVRWSAVWGARGALPVIAGIEIGLYLWAIASAIGVAALVASSELGLTVLRLVGAVVLTVLGVRAWLVSRKTTVDGPADAASVGGGWRRAGVTALLTSLSNPKVPVFVLAFYPQFVPAGVDALKIVMLLAALHVVIDAAWFVVLAASVGRVRHLLAGAKVRRCLERLTGTALIGLGIRVAAGKI